MKLTKERLKQLIKEELSNIIDSDEEIQNQAAAENDIAVLEDNTEKYYYRLKGNIMSSFNKDEGRWSTEPDKWSMDMKMGTLDKDMQQPMKDMIADLNGANWNLRELGKYHHKTNPMPTPNDAVDGPYKKFKDKAYTPGVSGAWAWKAKIHRGWRDHKTQAVLNAKGTGASSSLHTVLDSNGQPASLAADVIDRRYAWEGSKSPQFWNALRIATHNTGKLKIDIPDDDPAHVIHADFESGDAESIDNDRTQKAMASIRDELEAATKV